MPTSTEQKSNHTPGPWHVGYGTKVCAVYMKPASKGWLVRDQVARFDRTDEGMANARLIAAAPDLLAALKSMFDSAVIIGSPVGDMNAAEAAIAKAEGRS